MKKYFFISSLVVLLAISIFSVRAKAEETRLAECDGCGYCQARREPGNWSKCVQCLYPKLLESNSNLKASDNKTLEVKYPFDTPPVNQTEKYEQGMQVTPYPGRYFTQLGCMNTALSSFTDPQAAGGVLNFLLNKLIFPVVGILTFLSLIYGAFVLMTAQGDSGQIQRGKVIITSALVGIVFVLSSILIIQIIGGSVLKMPWFTKTS